MSAYMIEKTKDTILPLYAVIVTEWNEVRKPIITLSKEDCIDAFVMEIVKYVCDVKKDAKLFLDLFRDLREIYPNTTPNTEEIYEFLKTKGDDAINDALMLMNIGKNFFKRRNENETIADGARVTLDSDLSFTVPYGNQIEYNIQCWTPEQIFIASNRPTLLTLLPHDKLIAKTLDLSDQI